MLEYVTSKSTSGRDIFLFILCIYLLLTPGLGACFWLKLPHISNTPSYMHTLFCSVSSLGFCCKLFVGACDGFLFFRDDSLAFLQSYKVTLEDVYTTINKKPYKDHSDGLTKQITLDCCSYNAYRHTCTVNPFWGNSPWASWWLFIDGLLLSLFEI